MIQRDQPTIFPERFFGAVSCFNEGAIRHPSKDQASPGNIRRWCAELKIPLAHTVGLFITYAEENTYTVIKQVTAPLSNEGASSEDGWIMADALVTTTPGLAMILPVADCNAVLYVDPVQGVMALAHLGWHATVRNLASKLVAYLHEHFDTNPKDILIYNSPSIRAESYRFDYLSQTDSTRWYAEPYATKLPQGGYAIDLVAYNMDQWLAAGVLPGNIQVSPINTASSDDYPSHRMEQNSRFAALAMIR